MIDLNEFRTKLTAFNRRYISEFDGFWQRKLKIETKKAHILDDSHRDGTCRRLWSILRGWQAYRPFDSVACLRILEDSLARIADVYDQVRIYSLSEFDKVPEKPLELIWHELGRVKEEGGKRDVYGYYYIVSVSKHLMFLWGQTPAFDSKVRARIPRSHNVRKSCRWSFEDWMKIMKHFQEDLKDKKTLDAFNEESLKRYKTKSIVPYGRFFDIYYHK